MEIYPGIIIKDLGLFISKLKLLVISDLHIGYEEALAEQGIHLPKSQYPEIKKLIKNLLEYFDPKEIVINGDVKHEFGSATRQEWIEVLDLIDFLKEYVEEIVVVRGNHDNFLIPILKKKEVKLYDPFYLRDNIYFIHGHKELTIEAFNSKIIIIGHEHPAISLRDELGIKYKFKCFLKGDINRQTLIVLPSISPLMPGSSINEINRNKFLSPILHKYFSDEFEVYVSDPEIGTYFFGKIGMLKTLIVEE